MKTDKAGTASFGEALSIQGAVFKALLLREMTARFGRDNIGMLWLILEPLILASAITAVHLLRGGGHSQGGVQPGMFTLVGYTSFIIFRGLFNRAGNLADVAMPLLYHRMITLLDVLIVRTMIEVAGCFSAYLILMTIFIMLDMGALPARPLYVFAGFALIAWISTAAAMIVAFVSFGRPTVERMLHVFSYFMMPISGAFFMVEWLPTEYQKIVVWNPLTVIFETIRYGQFETASPDFINLGYVLAVTSFLTYTGLILLRRLRDRIHLA